MLPGGDDAFFSGIEAMASVSTSTLCDNPRSSIREMPGTGCDPCRNMRHAVEEAILE